MSLLAWTERERKRRWQQGIDKYRGGDANAPLGIISATKANVSAQVLATDPTLATPFRHLVSVRGIGVASAIQLLGELACLPSDMTVDSARSVPLFTAAR